MRNAKLTFYVFYLPNDDRIKIGQTNDFDRRYEEHMQVHSGLVLIRSTEYDKERTLLIELTIINVLSMFKIGGSREFFQGIKPKLVTEIEDQFNEWLDENRHKFGNFYSGGLPKTQGSRKKIVNMFIEYHYSMFITELNNNL